MSEGELLQALLESVDNEVAFMIGQVMGIMRKGDAIHIEKLVMHITDLEDIIAEQKTALQVKGDT
jgi:hypothetical protein